MAILADFAFPDNFWVGTAGSVVFGLIGVIILMLGFFFFDLLTRRMDIQAELVKGNRAVAIVIAALLISLAYITGHAIH